MGGKDTGREGEVTGGRGSGEDMRRKRGKGTPPVTQIPGSTPCSDFSIGYNTLSVTSCLRPCLKIRSTIYVQTV